jgi:uncharacterized protein YqhQ
MKKTPNPKAGFSRYEDRIGSAIMIMIVLISMTIFATVALQIAKLILP